MNWKGVLAGALGLVVLQRVTASAQGPGAVAGISGYAAAGVQRFLNPYAPLWSDAVLSKAGGTAAPKATTKRGAVGAIDRAIPPLGWLDSHTPSIFHVG